MPDIGCCVASGGDAGRHPGLRGGLFFVFDFGIELGSPYSLQAIGVYRELALWYGFPA